MTSRNQRKKRNKRNNNKNSNNGTNNGNTNGNGNGNGNGGRADSAAGGPSHGRAHADQQHRPGATRRSTETKPAQRTTELVAYAATVLAIVITALALDDDGQGGPDPFGAESAIRYITYLTVGYMVARGLAKAGSWQADETSDDHVAEAGAHSTGPVAPVEVVEVVEVDHREDDHENEHDQDRTADAHDRQRAHVEPHDHHGSDDDADRRAVLDAPVGGRVTASHGPSAGTPTS